jgi:hypothetical protein
MDKVEAIKSMYLILDNAGVGHSIIYPNVPFSVTNDEKGFKMTVFVPFDREVDENQPSTLILDYTDDPTPSRAGSVCSLGYYLMRPSFKNGKVINKSPLQIEGNLKDFEMYINRPQRPQTDFIKPVTIPEVNIGTNPYFAKYNVPRGGLNNLFDIYTVVWNPETLNGLYIEEVLDMDSFYNSVGTPVTCSTGKSIELLNKLKEKVNLNAHTPC